jgi:hypothetical protein
MISPEQLLADVLGMIAGAGAFGAVIDAVPSEGQQWTAFGLLAVVLGWFMHRFTKSIDENTKAQTEVAKSLALLTQREADAQHATDQKRIELGAKIDRIAEKIDSRNTHP